MSAETELKEKKMKKKEQKKIMHWSTKITDKGNFFACSASDRLIDLSGVYYYVVYILYTYIYIYIYTVRDKVIGNATVRGAFRKKTNKQTNQWKKQKETKQKVKTLSICLWLFAPCWGNVACESSSPNNQFTTVSLWRRQKWKITK